MYKRQHRTGKASANHSDASTNQFAPRRFVVQPQTEEPEQTPDLQAKSPTTETSSNNLANIPIFLPGYQPPPPPRVQMKLTIGEPGDKYEQEADKLAADVVQRINAPKNDQVQRSEQQEDEDELQMKPLSATIQRSEQAEYEDELQMKLLVQRQSITGGMPATPDLEESIQQSRNSGQPLGESVREPMEQAFGSDFSGVKIHTDAQSDQLNQSIQAKAFTTGQDIFFRQGAYQPESRGGQELIAHELTHVVQQGGAESIQRETSQPSSSSLAEKLGLMMKPTTNITESEAISPKSKSIPTKSIVQQSYVARKQASSNSGTCTAKASPNLLQRAITFQGNDNLNTLQTTYPNQLAEINGWDASPYTATYADNAGVLTWTLDQNSNAAIDLIVTSMLQNNAAAWSGTSATAGEIWTLVSDPTVVGLNRDDAAQLFRTHLMLHTHGATLAEAIGNLHGNVRAAKLNAIATTVGDSIGRPVIEGDVPQNAINDPNYLRGWAEQGWNFINLMWGGIENQNHKNNFIYHAFDHNKGYNRSINFILDWQPPEEHGGGDVGAATLIAHYFDDYSTKITQDTLPALNDFLRSATGRFLVRAINDETYTLEQVPEDPTPNTNTLVADYRLDNGSVIDRENLPRRSQIVRDNDNRRWEILSVSGGIFGLTLVVE
ncbi:DUF4157 domain-containing protein [Fortiea sp. LEGE XX443]|uniref:eCIS core domain-containing protein n=1 Tax=Fortiea sp. LEGE XX443 TaxID=1828611 RepID=UPI001882858C|nr:DUF4157 domain-containing protein [Fortiea sp. LEGE XX443]MBE9004756.1 DUF4157 domain-containing protein [Fortiea sp. LEGE XX443]